LPWGTRGDKAYSTNGHLFLRLNIQKQVLQRTLDR
jgi:hypothetical protein